MKELKLLGQNRKKKRKLGKVQERNCCCGKSPKRKVL